MDVPDKKDRKQLKKSKIEYQNKVNELFYSACSLGHIKLFDETLKLGVDIFYKDDTISTLHAAVMSGNREIVEKLLKLGIDIEVKDGDGKTPLFYAAYEGDIPMMEFLLNKGANIKHDGGRDTEEYQNGVEGYDWLGESILFETQADLDPAVVKFLIDHGADVDFAEVMNGNTPIVESIRKKRYENVKLLLEGGANIEHENGCGDPHTPLTEAILHSDEKMIDLLLEYGANPNYENMRGETPLTSSLRSGVDYDVIVKLILAGAKPDHVNIHNRTFIEYLMDPECQVELSEYLEKHLPVNLKPVKQEG